MINKNEIHQIEITDYGRDGEGIGRVDGFVVFIPNAVVGDIAQVKILKVAKSIAYGKIESIITPGPHRIKEECPHFNRCGGCCYQNIDYKFELERKKKLVTDCMERIGKFRVTGTNPDFAVHDVVGMENPCRYRNKAQYPIKLENNEIKIGFFAAHTHKIVEINDCIISQEINVKIIMTIKAFMQKYKITPYDEITHTGLVRHIYIRAAKKTGEIMVCLIINGSSLPCSEKLVAELVKIDNIKSICLNINTEKTNAILGSRIKMLYGCEYITDIIDGLKFNISPLSFFQINPIQTETLYKKALEKAEVNPTDIIFDAYCGAGTISLYFARYAKKIYGIEIASAAVADAEKNAALNKITNAEFITGKSEEMIPSLIGKGIIPDILITDPPRKGCDIKLLEAAVEAKIKKIVYISCDPSTLARDMKYLAENGYKSNDVSPMDMFPRTGHVETVVLLSRKKPNDVIHVDLALDELDITNAEAKATYEEIKAYVLEQSGLKVSSLYISQIKRKCGLEVGESYNQPKSDNPRVPLCPPEKEEAIMAALRHFDMV